LSRKAALKIKPVRAPSTDELESFLSALEASGPQRLRQRGWLGAGGLGVVDLVQDTVLSRDMARKTLAARGKANRSILRLFVREACIMAQLAHPSVVPVYDMGIDARGDLYFTMKQVQGQTLHQRILEVDVSQSRDGLFDLIEVVARVCDALAFAHERGVVHCDIKPDNIMLGGFGEVYVMDWGMARILGEAPVSVQGGAAAPAARATDVMVMGTPGYMAPEQARAERSAVDGRTDVYAVGALLYFALTRRAPHHADTPAERLRRAREARPPTPRSLVPGISSHLEDIILRAMAPDPAERFRDCSALKRALQGYVRDGLDVPQVCFEAGDVIIEEGSQGSAAYVIERGRCEVRIQTEGGVQRLGVMGPGEGFGELAIFNDAPRSASVVALEPVVLRCIEREGVESELAGMRPWMQTFIRTLARRFRNP
jgi:serine/threonine-protein kinase